MTLRIADRVWDLSETTGTVSFALDLSPPSTYQPFGSVCSNGDTIYYAAANRSASEWEVGLGTYTVAGRLLGRTTVLASSNGGSIVNFSAGTKDVMGVWPASQLGNILSPGGSTGAIQINNGGTFAGSVLSQVNGGLIANLTNPNAANNANQYDAFDINVSHYNYESGENPGFNNVQGLSVGLSVYDGQNTTGGLTSAKTTLLPFVLTGNYHCAGQKNLWAPSLASYGMGDTALGQHNIGFMGGPIFGDEGQAISLTSRFGQNPYTAYGEAIFGNIPRATITSVVRSGIAGGIVVSQPITGSGTAQTVSVSATTGINVGDWLVVGWEVPTGSPNMEAVRVSAVGVGTITAIFKNTQNSSATLNAALVLNCNGLAGFGQQRFVVNESQSAVTAGTVSAVSGSGFTGSGTSWSTSMAGSGNNLGAICLAADYYTSSPFGSSGASGTTDCAGLDSWYLIKAVNSATSLNIFSFSTSGVLNYQGRYGSPQSPSQAYTVRQAARILRMGPDTLGFLSTGTLVCEPSTSTWSNGDLILCPCCPYPDISARQELTAVWTTGGNIRFYNQYTNEGARAYEGFMNITANMKTGSNSDNPVGWAIGIGISNCITGLLISEVKSSLIPSVPNGGQFQGGGTSAAIVLAGPTDQTNLGTGRIAWGQASGWPYIEYVSTNGGLLINPFSVTDRQLTMALPSTPNNPDANLSLLSWTKGYFLLTGVGAGDPYIRMSNAGLTFTVQSRLNNADLLGGAGVDFIINTGTPQTVATVDGSGKFFFGNGTTYGVILDPTGTTAQRTVKWPDVGGDALVASTNTTGGGSAALGTNSPAVTNTAPYTWLQMKSHDGSTVYVPVWK